MLAPPTVVHASHDHVWLAWAPPTERTFSDSSFAAPIYEVLQRRLEPVETVRRLVHAAHEGSTTARIENSYLQPGRVYEFSVRATTFHGSKILSQPSRPVTLATSPDVLLLVARLPLGDGDALLQRHMQGLGMRTHAIPEEELPFRPKGNLAPAGSWAYPSVVFRGP